MPGLSGTGPLGEGPMSGRGLGYCRPGYERAVYAAPAFRLRRYRAAGYPSYGRGTGFGPGTARGRGRVGRGFRRWF